MNIETRYRRRALVTALAAALASLAGPAKADGTPPSAADAAQAAPPAADQPPATQVAPAAPPSRPTQLAPVVVTGNPLQSSDVATPSTVLTGDALTLRRGSTLGDTLDGLPGVSSSYFGPNANRPMIRGMDGDRVRILSNAGVPLDASSLSNDHAVPIDPLVVERIEVLRGPAALLYGGSAVGGVVNAIDNRIPRNAVSEPTGTVDLRYGGPATERAVSGIVEGGGNGFVVHGDGFYRKTDDMSVPTFQRPTGDGGSAPSSIIINSASRSDGGALGGSFVWDHGYAGAAVDTFRSNYGTVAEEDVTIDMYLNKLTLAGEVRDLAGPISRISAQWLGSDYQHQEIEGTGAVATTFKNKGSDFRIELEQARIELGGGKLGGVFGLQGGNNRFSALGEEAFVPSTDTKQYAGFVLEEYSIGSGTLSFGGRLGYTSVDSEGDPPGEVRFGPPQSRSFTPVSVAVGGVFNLSPQWQLTTNLAYTERAPTFYELYADGFHAATGAYEKGDPNQQMERGGNIDLGVQWKEGANLFKAAVFANNFQNYIFLRQTPIELPTPDGPVPVFVFTGVPARFYGAEVEGNWRVLDATQRVDLTGKLDVTQATNRDTDQPLPNIPPLRVNVGVNWSLGGWAARAEVSYSAAQNKVPALDPTTPSYTIVNLWGSYKFQWSGSEGFLYVRLNNLTNELAYNATTIDTVRPLAPLPGRGLLLGLRMGF